MRRSRRSSSACSGSRAATSSATFAPARSPMPRPTRRPSRAARVRLHRRDPRPRALVDGRWPEPGQRARGGRRLGAPRPHPGRGDGRAACPWSGASTARPWRPWSRAPGSRPRRPVLAGRSARPDREPRRAGRSRRVGPLVVDQADLTGPLAGTRPLDARWRAVPAVEGFRPETLDAVATDRRRRCPARSAPRCRDEPGGGHHAAAGDPRVRRPVRAGRAVRDPAAARPVRRARGLRRDPRLRAAHGAAPDGDRAPQGARRRLRAPRPDGALRGRPRRVPAVLVAPWLASLLVAAVGLNPALASVGLEAPLPGRRRSAWRSACGILAVLALTIPTLASGVSIAGARAAVGRQVGRTLPQRLGLDLALVALAAIALFQLRLYGAPLTRTARGSLAWTRCWSRRRRSGCWPARCSRSGSCRASRSSRSACWARVAGSCRPSAGGSSPAGRSATPAPRCSSCSPRRSGRSPRRTPPPGRRARPTRRRSPPAPTCVSSRRTGRPSRTGRWARRSAPSRASPPRRRSWKARRSGPRSATRPCWASTGPRSPDLVRMREGGRRDTTLGVAACPGRGPERRSAAGIAIADGTRRLSVPIDAAFAALDGFEAITPGYEGIRAARRPGRDGRLARLEGTPVPVDAAGSRSVIPLGPDGPARPPAAPARRRRGDADAAAATDHRRAVPSRGSPRARTPRARRGPRRRSRAPGVSTRARSRPASPTPGRPGCSRDRERPAARRAPAGRPPLLGTTSRAVPAAVNQALLDKSAAPGRRHAPGDASSASRWSSSGSSTACPRSRRPSRSRGRTARRSTSPLRGRRDAATTAEWWVAPSRDARGDRRIAGAAPFAAPASWIASRAGRPRRRPARARGHRDPGPRVDRRARVRGRRVPRDDTAPPRSDWASSPSSRRWASRLASCSAGSPPKGRRCCSSAWSRAWPRARARLARAAVRDAHGLGRAAGAVAGGRRPRRRLCRRRARVALLLATVVLVGRCCPGRGPARSSARGTSSRGLDARRPPPPPLRPAPTLGLVVLVLVTALLASLAPRVLAALADGAVRGASRPHRSGPQHRGARDGIAARPGRRPAREIDEAGQDRRHVPGPGPGDRRADAVVETAASGSPSRRRIPAFLRLRVQEGIDDHIRYIEGRKPTAAVETRDDVGPEALDDVPIYEGAVAAETAAGSG